MYTTKPKRGDKPRRGNRSRRNRITFTTALTVEECVERLERAAFQSLDHRFTVRCDGERFLIRKEWSGIGYDTQLHATSSFARLKGTLRQHGDTTHVTAYYADSSNALDSISIFVLGVGILGIMAVASVLLALVGVTQFLVFALIFMILLLVSIYERERTASDSKKKRQELLTQLWTWLYEPPQSRR